MAGHSKWANIKHRKAAQDAKRGKLFTKLIRELTVAARHGGGVVEDNPRLRAAVDKALASNMTRETIDRAIARGAGDGDNERLEEIVYEGYGPGGVAILVEAMSDNRNRTVAEVRHAFTKFGGNLGTDGSVAYLFTKQGIISLPPGCDEEQVLELSLDAGAEDVIPNDDGSVDVQTPAERFGAVKDALAAVELDVSTSGVEMVASNSVVLESSAGETILRLLDMLEDIDDVQNVYSNAELPDELLAES